MPTFASELVTPYELDLTNPLASALVGDGVGIFISDDNLVTVTNVVDGSAGVATDITNNERGTALGNYRVGYDYSGRTAAEQTQLDADPYQIFRTAEDELRDYGLKLTTASETLTLPMIGAYNVDVNYTDGTSANQTGSGSLVLDGTTTIHIASVTGSDSEGNIFYDCNQSPSAANVPELIQGKTGTLSGLPAAAGYVRDANSNDLIGYVLNDVSQTITYPLVGSWTGTITFSDDTTAARSGTGTHTETGATPKIIKSFVATDDNGVNNYDHTTGDNDSIPNVGAGASGNGTITSVPTSGFLPIIDTQVFTVAAANADFTTPQVAVSDSIVAGVVGYSKVIVLEDFNLGTNRVNYDSGVAGNTVELTSNEVFDGTKTSVPLITSANNTATVRCGGNTSWLGAFRVNNLAIENTNNDRAIISNNGTIDYFDVERCWLEALGEAAARGSTDNYKLTVKESVLVNNSTVATATGAAGALFDLYDNVLVNLGTGDAVNQNVTTAINNAHKGDIHASVSTQSNNHPVTDTAAAFADFSATPPDLRVKQSYADVNLTGAGWNGSDIAGWAYVDLSTPAADHTLTVAFSGLQPAFAATASQDPVVKDSSVAFNGLEPVFAATMVNANPVLSSSVAFTGLQPAFSATVTNVSDGVNSSVVSIDGLQPAFAASITKSTPSTDASIAFTGLQPAFSATVNVGAPTTQSTVAFNGLQPTFSASVTLTNPVLTANVAFDGPVPIFKAYMINGDLIYVTAEDTNLLVGVESRHCVTHSPSRNIKL